MQRHSLPLRVGAKTRNRHPEGRIFAVAGMHAPSTGATNATNIVRETTTGQSDYRRRNCRSIRPQGFSTGTPRGNGARGDHGVSIAARTSARLLAHVPGPARHSCPLAGGAEKSAAAVKRMVRDIARSRPPLSRRRALATRSPRARPSGLPAASGPRRPEMDRDRDPGRPGCAHYGPQPRRETGGQPPCHSGRLDTRAGIPANDERIQQQRQERNRAHERGLCEPAPCRTGAGQGAQERPLARSLSVVGARCRTPPETARRRRRRRARNGRRPGATLVS